MFKLFKKTCEICGDKKSDRCSVIYSGRVNMNKHYCERCTSILRGGGIHVIENNNLKKVYGGR